MSERHRQAKLKTARRDRLWRACLAGLIDFEICDEVNQIMFGEESFLGVEPDPIPMQPRRRPSKPRPIPRIMYLISNGEHASGHLLTVERFVETDCAAKLERAMHCLLGARHERREWFKMTNAEWDALLPKAIELTHTM